MSSYWPAPDAAAPPEPDSVEPVKTSPSALVLHRRLNLGVQFLRRAPRPIRIAQEFASQKYQISLSRGEDCVGLSGVGDHADGSGQDFGLLADRFGERDLIAGADGNLLKRHEPAARSVDQINAEWLQASAQFDGFADVPAAFRPVGRRHAAEKRQIRWPNFAHRLRNFERKTNAILEAATVLIVALVAERGQELVNQVSVSRMNLNDLKSRSQ